MGPDAVKKKHRYQVTNEQPGTPPHSSITSLIKYLGQGTDRLPASSRSMDLWDYTMLQPGREAFKKKLDFSRLGAPHDAFAKSVGLRSAILMRKLLPHYPFHYFICMTCYKGGTRIVEVRF